MIELKKSEVTTILNLVSKLKIKNDVVVIEGQRAIIFNENLNIKAEIFIDSHPSDYRMYIKMCDVKRIKKELKNQSDYVMIEKVKDSNNSFFYKVNINDNKYFENQCNIETSKFIDLLASFSDNELLNIEAINLCSPCVLSFANDRAISQLHIEKRLTLATDGKQLKTIENSQSNNITCNISGLVLPLMKTYKNKKWYITKKDANNNRLLNTELFNIIYKDIGYYPSVNKLILSSESKHLTRVTLNSTLLDELKEFKKTFKKVKIIEISFQKDSTIITDVLANNNSSYEVKNETIGNICVDIDYIINMLEVACKESITNNFVIQFIKNDKKCITQYHIYNEDIIYIFMGIQSTSKPNKLKDKY